jgi:prolipoprotein diacylglyceryl transferase
MILGIEWNVDAQIIDGMSTPNLYGLLFVTGLIVGFFVIKRMFAAEQIPEKWLDSLLIYVVLATIIGARLGHVFFYGPYFDVYTQDGFLIERGYLSNPADIFKVWEGGLASHGGAIAILIALYIYSKKVSKKNIWWILDRIVAPIAIAGCFIRLGNLVNHEIVGVPTDLPWGFKFMHSYPDEFRHPAQLYESIAYLFIFFLLLFLFWKTNWKERRGMIFGVFLVVLWGARFLVEFVKIPQESYDLGWTLNTGQLLSIPFIIAGFIIFYLGSKRKLNELAK